MKQIQVTKLEKVVLEGLVKEMFAEVGFSDAGIDEISKNTGLSTKVIRGVASSLTKKGLIFIDTREGTEFENNHRMHIWHLESPVLGLAECWVGQEEFRGGIVESVELVVKN